MAILIGALLAILSIAVLIYPFLKTRNARHDLSPGLSPAGSQDSGGLTDATGPDLETVYEAIRTLQLEYQLGNVPQGLYREQLDAYRIQAAMALKRQTEDRQDDDWLLEQEISVARASIAHTNGHTVRCANCGSVVTAAVSHCPECNADMDNQPQPPGGADRG